MFSTLLAKLGIKGYSSIGGEGSANKLVKFNSVGLLDPTVVQTDLIDHADLINVGTSTHAEIDAHITNTSNPHSVTKTQVGLGNCDNTSDINKPISTLTQAALDLKADGASLTTHIADEAKHLTSTQNTLLDSLTATVTELNYVDGVTSAIQTQLDSKATISSLTSHTDNISNPHSVTKTQVGLGNCDNTSDVNKPISTATQAALDLKAPLASPALTGVPTVPTAISGTNSTQAASTAFVKGAIDDLIAGSPGALDTLNEIATQLALDEDAVSALTIVVASKVPNTRTVNGYALSSDVALVKSDIGLGNCDNTSDVSKPISTLTQAALDLKAAASDLTTHIADETKHLTSAQNTLLDALTATAAELNHSVGVTSAIQTQLDAKTTALNSHIADAAKHLTSGQNSLLDALTASAVELNHSVGVTSAIQTQLDTKAADADLTTHIADATKHLTSGQNALLDAVTVSATELNRLTGVSGNVQTQLDAKAVASDLTTHIADETKHLTSAQNTLLDSLTASAVEINYVDGVTSAIQTQLNDKASNAAMADRLLAGNNLADLYDPAEARTNLGLSDGALLPLSSQVQAEAGVHTNSVMNPLRTAQAITAQTATPLAGKLAIASNLSDLNNPSTARTNLGLAIGSNVQAWNTRLDGLAGVANSAGVYTNNGSGTMSITATSLGGNGATDGSKLAKFQVDGSLSATGLYSYSPGEPTVYSKLGAYGIDFTNMASSGFFVSIGISIPSENTYLSVPAVTGGSATFVTTGNLSSITSVGTLSSGTWNAADIDLAYIAQGGATNGQALLWNNTGGTWEPGTISSGITIGSTEITSGTSGRLLTSGTTVGELTLGTGVSTALGINVGSSGAFITNGGALGTPSSGTGTNITGIPPANITGTAATLSGANVFTSTSGVTINDGTNSGAYKITGTDRSVTLTLSSFGNGLQIAGNGDLVMAGGRIRLTDSAIGTRYGYLFGVAADHVGLTGNGGGEKFSVYGTTNETNYERFTISTAIGAAYTVGAQAGGTGTLRDVNAVGAWTFTAPTLVGATVASGTLTASAPVTISQTWNNAAVAFTGLDINITETVAAGLSTYMRVRTSRSNADVFKLQYSQYGTYTDMILGGTTADATSIILRSGYGQAQVYAGSLGLYSDSGNGFIFASSNGAVASYLSPSAGKIFHRNSTTAQSYNVCNTFTSTTSFEAMTLDWSSNVGRVGSLKGSGGGSAREWVLHHDGTEKARVSSSGFTIGAAGTPVSSVISATATLDFDLTSVIVQDLTMTVTGAAVGDVVSIGVPHGSVTATAQYTAWVSATNTVTVRCRTAVAGENPASGTFRATIIKH